MDLSLRQSCGLWYGDSALRSLFSCSMNFGGLLQVITFSVGIVMMTMMIKVLILPE